ncbi:hypothetical protein NM208_g16820 [Fusarium decemcellulare]|uniref:Uncharacterized protein n=1 Tax=Fusarium decemcellulare TaxID=57161 RepID=A0ACC1R937_9HYPO|nr:hypothetical protein NM208_g16820 [Fusarium decemcellulare]
MHSMCAVDEAINRVNNGRPDPSQWKLMAARAATPSARRNSRKRNSRQPSDPDSVNDRLPDASLLIAIACVISGSADCLLPADASFVPFAVLFHSMDGCFCPLRLVDLASQIDNLLAVAVAGCEMHLACDDRREIDDSGVITWPRIDWGFPGMRADVGVQSSSACSGINQSISVVFLPKPSATQKQLPLTKWTKPTEMQHFSVELPLPARDLAWLSRGLLFGFGTIRDCIEISRMMPSDTTRMVA